jgi:hypothetical protein
MKAVDIAHVAAPKGDAQVTSSIPEDYQEPKYPYGTEMHLDHDTLAKIEAGNGELPQVGKEMNIVAKGRVTSHAIEQMQDGSTRSHARVQLTHIGHDGNDGGEKTAGKMYPSASGE